VGWLLLDRFVRTAQSLEAVNQGLEQRVARREAELAENFERLAQAERARAVGDERQRLLRELHDGVGARLVHLQRRIEAGTLDPEGLSRDLQDGLADMRLASETLNPDLADLADSVGNFLFRWEPLLRQAGVRPHWQIDLPAGGPSVPAYDELQLLRILQEALTNVLRHAEASSVALEAVVDGERLRFDFRDDGVGLEPGVRGRGLDAMRTRALALRGQFSVDTTPGGGTRIQVSVPLMPATR
jgi:signal transduction histidine kinase